ncbi:MAG: RIP metalloprotease RseP [Methylotenera sp.]|nr:RIP metalloprotease RseP [Methylotenera sp.]
MLTALAFIFTIGLLVTVHEYGHFQVARWCGVKVLKFSVGFGKPLWRKKFGADQTEFVIAAIPLGGYVKMMGEDQFSQDEAFASHDMARALNRQSVGKRMAIVLAGPLANLLLAIILYWILFMMGVVGLKPIVGNVVEHSPAAATHISSGDVIQKINNKDVATWQDVRWLLLQDSLKNKQVEIQAINAKNEMHVYQIDVSTLDYDDAKQDILEKLGLTIYRPRMPAIIGEIANNSPAQSAGLKPNDLVLAINQNKVNNWEFFVQEIQQHPDVNIDILVQRDAEKISISVKPDSVVENGKTIGRIGAAFKIGQTELDQFLVTSHYSVAGALVKAVEKTWDTAIFSLKMLGNMLVGQVSWKGMSGPVTIASYAGQSANMGIKVFIGFLALISISIGVLNLLPIPILDGGHFMYYMVEFFTKKPVSEAVMNFGQKVGFILLGSIMVLALYNDINRLTTG